MVKEDSERKANLGDWGDSSGGKALEIQSGGVEFVTQNPVGKEGQTGHGETCL